MTKPCTLLTAVLLLTAGPILRAQPSPQAIFDQGNVHLQEGEIRQAIENYRKLIDNQTVSGALYLNLGISYIEMDSLGMAKYYFLKASRFDETEEAAQKALQYVDERFSRQSAILPKLPWDKAVDWLKLNIGAGVLLGIGVILLNGGVIAYVIPWFIDWQQKVLRIGGLSTSILGALIILGSFYVRYVENRYDMAVMVHEQANVLEKPEQNAPIISKAYEGYTFTVDAVRSREKPGWNYVRMSNGLFGWIPDNEIRIL